jgi:hypothetical protein
MGRIAHFSTAAGIVALALSYVCSAQNIRHEGMGGMGMMNDSMTARGTMTGKGAMDSTGMCMMCKDGMGGMGMMSMMMPSKVIVVEDGYLVQVCNTLIKYDKELNKKKEVVVALDSMAMKSMMQQMGSMKKMHMAHMKTMHDMPMREKAKEMRK